MRKLPATIAVVVALPLLAAAAIGGAVLTIDWREVVQARVSEATGRRFSAGRLAIIWSWPIRIEATDLRLANADWGSQAAMLEVGRLVAVITTRDIIGGVAALRRVRLEGATLLLERNQQGRGNWSLAAEGAALRQRLPFPQELEVHDSRILYRGVRRTADVAFARLRVEESDERDAIRVSGEGGYNGTPVTLSGIGGSVARLRDASQPFPMTFTLQALGTTWSFDGAAGEPFLFRAVEGRSYLAGPDLHEFGRIAGIPAPPTPDYEVAGHLSRQERLWRITEAQGRFAGDAFRGALTIEMPVERPVQVGLEMAFSQLRPQWIWDRLSGTPGAADGKAGARPGWSLNAVVSADRLIFPDYPLGGGRARLMLRPGGLSAVDPLRLEVAGGTVEGRLSARHANGERRASAQLSFRGLDLGRLAAAMGGDSGAVDGRFGGTAALHATGRTTADMLPTLGGRVLVYAEQGTIRRSLVSRISADLTRILVQDGAGHADIVCLAGEMTIDDAMGTIRGLVLHTQDATIGIGGRVDLLERTLDVTLQGEPRGFSFFDLDAPVRLYGPWRDPQVSVDASPLITQGGIAALLGMIASPMAALIPMIGLGDSGSSPCVGGQ